MKKIFYAVTLLSCIIFPSSAQINRETEVAGIKEKAIKGDPYFQGLFSGICRRGEHGAKPNYAEALKWAELSALRNNPLGLYNLAALYEEGLGIKKDPAEAERLYKTAVEGLTELARNGDTAAQYSLGYMYIKEKGVNKDELEGYYWTRRSAEAGNASAQYIMGYLYFNGNSVIKKDLTKSFSWIHKAALNGDPRGQCLLGVMFYNAFGTDKDFVKAAEWLGKSSEQKDSSALYLLGLMYEDGKGVPKDKEKASALFKRSAEQGYAPAKEKLSKLKAHEKTAGNNK